MTNSIDWPFCGEHKRTMHPTREGRWLCPECDPPWIFGADNSEPSPPRTPDEISDGY